MKKIILALAALMMVGCRYKSTGSNIREATNAVIVVDMHTLDSCEVKMNKRGNSLVESGHKVTKTTSGSYQFGGSYEERMNESLDSSLGGYKANRFLGVLG